MSVEKCRRPRCFGDELGQAGLVDRDLAALEALDLVGVDVDAPDLVAELGEAGRGDEADVAGADDADGFARAAHERRTRIAAASAPRRRGRSRRPSRRALSARRPGSATARSRASARFVSVRDSVFETQYDAARRAPRDEREPVAVVEQLVACARACASSSVGLSRIGGDFQFVPWTP